jgi:Flp pilus assembly protein TadG
MFMARCRDDDPMNTRRDHAVTGQDLLEYALMLPFFLWTLMAIFDIGRAVFFYSSLSNATREAARYGVVHYNDTTNVRNIVCDRAPGLNPGQLNACNPGLCTVNPNVPCWSLNWGTITKASPGTSRLTVSAAYLFDPITPFVDFFMGGGDIVLRSQSIMQAESFPP